ncbi:hypothetical protein [Cyanobium sp. ATX-6F1]|uniref:hypothetical protein n=1 Tax=Cyanobium sp. ATX-6F1 TaxID=3137388 RepID=UPI0039BE0460
MKHPSDTTEAAMRSLILHGLCRTPAEQWLALGPAQAEARAELLTETYRRLEECPTPTTEWQGLRELLGDELLAPLVAVSLPSLRRYAKGERVCPDRVAARLHWLALLIDHLEGSYNPYGIRRWFQRPRSALGGQAPHERLHGDWDPDEATVQAVLGLAEATRLGMTAS